MLNRLVKVILFGALAVVAIFVMIFFRGVLLLLSLGVFIYLMVMLVIILKNGKKNLPSAPIAGKTNPYKCGNLVGANDSVRPSKYGDNI